MVQGVSAPVVQLLHFHDIASEFCKRGSRIQRNPGFHGVMQKEHKEEEDLRISSPRSDFDDSL